MRVFTWSAVFWLVLALVVIKPIQPYGACLVTGTTPDGGAFYVCTDADAVGVVGGTGSDNITVAPGAEVGKIVQQTLATAATANVVTLDAGNGLNSLTNFGSSAATAGATAQPVAGSASLATTQATVVKSGNGADSLQNSSRIASSATSSATSAPISLTLAGSASGERSTRATASSVGVDGGAGQNQLTNTGNVIVNATATSDAPLINVNVSNSALADVGVTAETEGTGIRGAGSVTNLAPGAVTVTLFSQATAESVQATVGDSARADLSVDALASAYGISGSSDNNTILSEGPVKVDSTATAAGNVDLESSATNVAIDASIRAEAGATGIDGGDGDDTISNSSTITPTSIATAKSDNAGASYWAPGVTDAIAGAIARTAGITGGGGADTITNTGTINATAQATTEPTVFLGSFGIELAKTLESGKGGSATSCSWGVDGGEGADTITSNGSINAMATATSTSFYTMLTEVGLGMFYTPVNAVTQSAGIAGGGGSDTITNSGPLTATATSTASTTNLSVSGLQLDIFSDGDASVDATATATGISGGDGDDTITNRGTVITTGNGIASSTRLGFQAVGTSRVTADVVADSTAKGIDGGSGNDQITNATGAMLSVAANSNADSFGLDGKLMGLPTQPFSWFGMALDSAATVSRAAAFGIDGGAGNDTITNNATIIAGASADADSETISVTFMPPLSAAPSAPSAGSAQVGATAAAGPSAASPAATGNSLVEAGTGAFAEAGGLVGGDGSDTITNNGSLAANALADAYALGVTAGISYGKGGVMASIFPSVTLVDATTKAAASAVGMDGGAGNDTLQQNNTLTVTGNSYATSTGVGVNFKAEKEQGIAWGGTKTDASTTATAAATGISGGDGDDVIVNAGTHNMTVNSYADATAAGVSLTVLGSGEGLAGGVSYADGTTKAEATSVGIDGGAGNDGITNGADLEVNAVAEGTSGNVSVSAAATKTGVSLDVALADAKTTATAAATGIKAGEGNDQVTSTDSITANSSADIDSASVSVGLGFSNNGLVAGVAAADLTVSAGATAAGIDGGAGNDTVYVSGSMTTTASASVAAASVSVEAGVAVNGVAAGGALAKGGTTATAAAAGVEGGTGNDTLTNSGINTVVATSSVATSSVGVELKGTSAGLAAGVSAVGGDNTVRSTAVGLSGGLGDDKIYNYNSSQVGAIADSTRGNVSVTGTFALQGIAAGASIADASNTVTAEASGMDGGTGNDTLINNASLATNATTTATTASVAVDVNVSATVVSAGASIASAATTATALATGMTGGAGNDWVENQGSGAISGTAGATAKTTTVSVDVSLGSFSKVEASSTATAGYAGMEGGAGQDTLTNRGSMDISAVATGDGTTGKGELIGYGTADVSVNSSATTLAMSGGADDDTLWNGGAIVASGAATAKGLAVSGDIAGFGDVEGRTSSTATVAGLDGGDGGNTVTNASTGSVTLTATASGTASTYDIKLGGGGSATAGTDATALAYGMHTGSGADFLYNYGAINLGATSSVTSDNVSLRLFGVSIGDASSTSSATAYGIEAGDGANTVVNGTDGTLVAKADATATATSVDVEIGVAAVSAATNATAKAAGIKSGNGVDSIYNYGDLQALAKSKSTTVDGSISLASFSFSDSTPGALAEGINAGGGNDTVVNTGFITAGGIGTDPMAYAEVGTANIDFANFSSTQFAARAQATGIDGGTGNDTITNQGTINVGGTNWMSKGVAFGFTCSFLGMVGMGANAYTVSLGIGGGDGTNTLTNDVGATLTVRATSNAYTKGAADTSFGKIAAFADATSSATATGIAGGKDDDTIENKGTLVSNAKTWADTYADANVGGGSPTADSSATATATARGIDAGEGTNHVTNAGELTVNSDATATPISYANANVGRTDSDAQATATATAHGIVAGGGGDTITNLSGGNITVTATADTEDDSGNILKASQDVEADVTAGNSGTPITARAVGISSGGGGDTIINNGVITASASSTPSGYANTSSYVYYPSSEAHIYSSAIAKGIETADRSKGITNTGTIDVSAWSHANPITDSWARDYVATTDALANSKAAATGIEGKGTITNASTGDIDVTARATAYADSINEAEHSTGEATLTASAMGISTAVACTAGCPATADSISNHGDVTVSALAGEDANALEQTTVYADSHIWVRDAHSTATGTAGVTATGIGLGAGNASVVNTGRIDVTAREHMNLTATAFSRDYNPFPVATADGSATAAGVAGTDGVYQITNEATGVMIVTAEANGFASSSGSTNAPRYAWGTSTATTTSAASGIMTGATGAVISNFGDLTVGSTASADARAWADAGSSSDGTAASTATATAGAYGIRTGGGADIITNGKKISVTASAVSYAYAYADADGWGEGEISTTNATGNATAWGIHAGAGNNIIVNQGDLTVRAETTTTAISATEDETDHRFSSVQHSETAVGIETGSGDDRVSNYGTITTTQVNNGVSTPGTAITTGAGNDQVLLGNGSRTMGHIDLGDGDDGLIFQGTTLVSGTVTGGAGTDTLVFDGSGSIAFAPVAFEQAVKQGAGTFTIPALPTMQRIEVNRGVLETNSNYQFSAGGLIRTVVNGDGSFGQFRVNGNAQLAGDLSVLKGPGPYLNGTTYRIIESANAAGVSGAFSAITLPEAKPLVGFNVRQLQDAVQVEVGTRSFTTVATNPVEWAVAGYLDRIMPTATGDLSDVLGEFQSLAQPQFHTAFSSLGPATYDGLSKAGLAGLKQYQNSLRQRMSNVRAYNVATGYGSEPQRVLLAYNGSDANLGRFLAGGQGSRSQAGIGLWIDSYGQWGDQRGAQGVTGYDYDLYGGTIGYDSTFPNNLMLGISIGTSRAAIDFDENMGDGSVKDVTGSLYGSYLLGDAYIEGVLSYGRERFRNHRRLSIGSIQRDALSSHSGDAYSVYLGAGYDYKVGNSAIIPFAAIRYAHLDEEGFSESGAGSLDLTLDRRRTDSLVSELGVRAARAYKLNSGSLVPEFSAAFSYDFDIDDRVITSSFAGSPGAAFSIKGQQVEKYGAVVNAGLTFIHDCGVSTSIKYSGEFRERSSSHGVIGNLRYQF